MKKRVVVIIACLVLIAMSFSCFFLFRTKNVDPLAPFGIVKRVHLDYDSIDTFNNVYVVSLNNKYGLLNKNYELIDLSFDAVSDMGKQYIVLNKDGKDSLFDKNGVLIINGNKIDVITNAYGDDAYYVCNDKCKLYYDQKVIYEGNDNIVDLIDKYVLFDNYMIDVTNGAKTYYDSYYNDNNVNVIVYKDGTCIVFDFNINIWKKYDSYDSYSKTNNDNKKMLEDSYYMDYAECLDGAILKKDGNTIIGECYLYYDLSLKDKDIIVGMNEDFVKIHFDDELKIIGDSYDIVGNYLILYNHDDREYYNFDGKKEEVACSIIGYHDGKYICNDGLYKYFVNDKFEIVSEKYKNIECFSNICLIKNKNNMYAIYSDDYLTDFVYYDYYIYDNFLVGYYINSLDVLELGNSFDLVKKEEIVNESKVYSDLEIINIIYQYNLKSIEDLIKDNKELFTIYAETAINNPMIKDYLDKVLLTFKTVCINKEYLDLDYFIGRLKTLKIVKSDKVSVENAAGVYNKTSNDIKMIDDSNRVIMHELTHFVDFSINEDMNSKLYNCDGELTIISDLNSYSFNNKDKKCESINGYNRFMVEAGAEYYNALYYDSYAVTAYHNSVSVYGLLSEIFGQEKMRECYLSEDGYLKMYELLQESKLSLSEAIDFLDKISYITDFNAELKGQYYLDVCDYLVRIIKNTSVDWYSDASYIYVISGLLSNVDDYSNYSSVNKSDYDKYCFDADNYKDIQQNILNKATTLYTIGGVKSSAVIWDDHTYVTFTTYYTDYTDWKSSLYYVVVDYDFSNDKVNSYKLYPIYG